MQSPARLLVAEDNPALAGVVSFNLTQAGFDVVVRHNGNEAWQTAQKETFDLILLDQQMPGINGDEVCKKLRSHDATREIPVVMVTAKGLEMDRSRLRDELGVTDVISKPFSPTELVTKVQTVLSSDASSDESPC